MPGCIVQSTVRVVVEVEEEEVVEVRFILKLFLISLVSVVL